MLKVQGLQQQTDLPLAPNPVELVDQKIETARQEGRLPSLLLLQHAADYFNLNNDPRWPLLPISVKWQIFHAASAYKDGDGVVHLSAGEFGIDHLSTQDLALLYRVIRSYHLYREKFHFGEHAIFDRHIEAIEARFIALSKNSQRKEEILQTLQGLGDANLAPLIQCLLQLGDVEEGEDDIDPALPLVDQKILKAMRVTERERARGKMELTYPSSLLLQFVQENYDLTGDTDKPTLPAEVKWQIFHAAVSKKVDKNGLKGIVSFGEEFFIDHLSYHDLAILLKVFTEFYAYEIEKKGAKEAIFHKHIMVILARFERICWTDSHEGEKALVACREVAPKHTAVQRLETILKNKERYLAVDRSFEHDAEVAGLFAAETPEQLSQIFSEEGYEEKMGRVNQNFLQFKVWLKAISLMENQETDKELKVAVSRWKSEIQERFYQERVKLICKIYDAYPDTFQNIFARWNTLAILNKGMEILFKKLQEEELIQGEIIICRSYDDYKAQLASLANKPDGQWYMSIRCERENPKEFGVHQTGVFVEKMQGQFYVQIIDASSFDIKNGPYFVAEITFEVFPEALVNTTMCVRQRDFMNCSFFEVRDFIALYRNRENITWLRQEATPILEQIAKRPNGAEGVQWWSQNVPEALLKVRATADVPLEFITPAQSFSQLRAAIKAKLGPASAEAIAKLEKKMWQYNLMDVDLDSPIYGNPTAGYTRLKALEYRLAIAERAFNK